MLFYIPAVAQQNTANNPLTDIPMIQAQDYLQTGIRDEPRTVAYQRFTLPWEIGGFKQLMRISAEAGSTVAKPDGTVSGLGDTTIYNVPIFTFPGFKMGVGPLAIIPTASNPVLGDRQWQIGGEGVISAPFSWGLLGGLVSYQQVVDGSSRSITAQPFIFGNLAHGFYLRSTGIMMADLVRQSTVLPIGFGLGRVMPLENGNVLNFYVEPQFSVVRTSDDKPLFQIFVGVNLQFPPQKSVRHQDH